MDITNVKNQRLLTRWILWGLTSIIIFCVLALIYIMVAMRRPEVAGVRRIPLSAVWVGGRPGGSWIELIESKNDQDYHLKVYHDATGELERDGWFRISDICQEQPIDAAKFYDIVDGYDGNQVHVAPADGRQYCFLKPAQRDLAAQSTILYRLNQQRVTHVEFDRMKSSLQISEKFTEGETERSPKHGKMAGTRGYVHIREAIEPSTGKKYQYTIESFEGETTYTIQAVVK